MNGRDSIPFIRSPPFDQPDYRRAIPSVETILCRVDPLGLPRQVVLSLVRQELSSIRDGDEPLSADEVFSRVRLALQKFRACNLQPVINGTGILLHTNLGRAPLAPEAVAAIAEIGGSYNNLEYDLWKGARGCRGSAVEHGLALLCEAEAATVVNNCAAALVLVVQHFTVRKRQVIVSRGELLQIGGGFRIPEILEASGARLREVGTTNQTTIEDYANAIDSSTGLILKVHRSNFHMDGFVASPATEAIAALARKKRVAFVEDLGSGSMVATEEYSAIDHEPTPLEVLAQGANLVMFSGDKLFGGPQAGIIAGARSLITALKREPFFRALRCDKLILAALEATVKLYLNGSAVRKIPVLNMLQLPVDELQSRAIRVAQQLAGLSVTAKVSISQARVGGGSLPRSAFPSVTLELVPDSMDLAAFASRLRAASPPILGCISSGAYQLDFRTIFPHQDAQIVQVVKLILSEARSESDSAP